MGPNLCYKLRHKEGYFPVPPADSLMDIRNEMMVTMIECGLDGKSELFLELSKRRRLSVGGVVVALDFKTGFAFRAVSAPWMSRASLRA